MSLLNNLYTATPIGEGVYRVRFAATHPVFAGHFPGRPIVPGACLVQAAEDLISLLSGERQQTTRLSNLKFRRVVTPDKTIEFHFTPKETPIYSVLIRDEQTIYAQFSATYMRHHTDL